MTLTVWQNLSGKDNLVSAFRRVVIFAALCLFTHLSFAQDNGKQLKKIRLEFYARLVANGGIDDLLDDSLSYGHSNGWIETKPELINNLGKKLVYHSISEDSLQVTMHGDIAHARFVGDFDVSLNGKRKVFRLRVLEVWVKREQGWKIFARQAIRNM